jgi:hypothetical protein
MNEFIFMDYDGDLFVVDYDGIVWLKLWEKTKFVKIHDFECNINSIKLLHPCIITVDKSIYKINKVSNKYKIDLLFSECCHFMFLTHCYDGHYYINLIFNKSNDIDIFYYTDDISKNNNLYDKFMSYSDDDNTAIDEGIKMNFIFSSFVKSTNLYNGNKYLTLHKIKKNKTHLIIFSYDFTINIKINADISLEDIHVNNLGVFYKYDNCIYYINPFTNNIKRIKNSVFNFYGSSCDPHVLLIENAPIPPTLHKNKVIDKLFDSDEDNSNINISVTDNSDIDDYDNDMEKLEDPKFSFVVIDRIKSNIPIIRNNNILLELCASDTHEGIEKLSVYVHNNNFILIDIDAIFTNMYGVTILCNKNNDPQFDKDKTLNSSDKILYICKNNDNKFITGDDSIINAVNKLDITENYQIIKSNNNYYYSRFPYNKWKKIVINKYLNIAGLYSFFMSNKNHLCDNDINMLKERDVFMLENDDPLTIITNIIRNTKFSLDKITIKPCVYELEENKIGSITIDSSGRGTNNEMWQRIIDSVYDKYFLIRKNKNYTLLNIDVHDSDCEWYLFGKLLAQILVFQNIKLHFRLPIVLLFSLHSLFTYRKIDESKFDLLNMDIMDLDYFLKNDDPVIYANVKKIKNIDDLDMGFKNMKELILHNLQLKQIPNTNFIKYLDICKIVASGFFKSVVVGLSIDIKRFTYNIATLDSFFSKTQPININNFISKYTFEGNHKYKQKIDNLLINATNKQMKNLLRITTGLETYSDYNDIKIIISDPVDEHLELDYYVSVCTQTIIIYNKKKISRIINSLLNFNDNSIKN